MNHQRQRMGGKHSRATLMVIGVALALVTTACGSSSTTSSPSSSPSVAPSSAVAASPTAGAPAASAPVASAPAATVPASSAPAASSPAASAPAATVPASSAPAASAPAASAPATTVDTTSDDAVKVLGLMKKSLLTPKEVGTGFTAADTPADNAATPTACGTKSVLALYPNVLRSGEVITSGETAQFQEQLSLFVDTETAQAAFKAQVAGITCSKGSISGTPVTFGALQDVTSQVGGEKAVAATVSFDGATGVLIAVGSGSTTVGYTFLAATGTDTSKLPNPLDLAKKATAKVLAAGLG